MRRRVMSILLCIMIVTSVFGAMVQYVQLPDSNKSIMAEDSITPYGIDGYELANEDSKLKVYFDERSLGDGVKVSVGNHWVVWKWKEMSYISNNDGIETISTVSGVEGTFENNVVTYDETYPFSKEIFTVSNNRLKHDIILSQLPYSPTSLDNVDYLSYIGILDFPPELSMYVDGIEQEGDFITSSKIVFVDENGIELFYMPEPYAYEKNNEQERIDCQYEVNHVNGEVLFFISTPYYWLSDPARNFPVVIDPTVISGYLYSDTIWTLANSPYIVTDDITVVPGVTLTIEQGVVVKFDGPYELVIDGYLNAQGTVTNNIVFTSNSPTPAVGDWLGIKFRDTSPDHGSVLDWVTVMYSEKGISFEHTSQSISHMSITNNEYGVYIYEEWGSLTCSISNSDIYDNTYGIFVSDYHITITVSGCDIFDNEYGIHSDAHDSLSITNSNFYNNTYGLYSRGITTVSNSEFYQNEYGIYVRYPHTTISNCDIHDNEYGIYIHGAYGCYGRASVSNSDINNNEYGIYGYSDHGSLTISGSSINNNLHLGVSAPGPLTITDSRIINNGGNGIEICKESTIHYSDIYGNFPYDAIIVNDFYFIVDATNNWWGTTNDSLIEQKIYDYNDDYNLTFIFLWPKSIVPFSPNNPPVANIGGPYIGEENSPIVFDASSSYDIDNNILQYRWDFSNDGIWDTGYSVEPIISYTWGDDYSGFVAVEVYDGEFTDTAASNVTVYNVVPSPNIVGPNTIDENSPLNLEGYGTDPGSDDLTYTWEFEFGPTITSIYYNNGIEPDSHPSPEINPMDIMEHASHIYGDNGVFAVKLTVEDDDGGIAITTFNVTVNNVLPVVDPGGPYTIDENSPITLTVMAYDTGSDDLTITWDWGDGFSGTITTTYFNNGIGPDPSPSPEINPISFTESQTHTYGDNGVFNVTLTVVDDDGGTTIATEEVIVNNIAPTIVDIEAYMYVNFSLRVAGEKWHSVGITLYEDDVQIWNAQVTRQPGNPDEQAASLNDYSINLGSSYRAVVDYLPNDPRVNGNVWGGNPVWIILEFQDGTTERVHHTFNVRQSYWDTDHWNHIDPWEVDLTGIIYRHNITFEATASDPGSDDLSFIWDFSDGGNAGPNSYFNNGMNPDPYPSPEINSMIVSDITMHAYAAPGTYTVTLTVMDDDGGIVTATFIIVLPG